MLNRRKIINYIVQTAIFGGLATILYVVPGLQFNLPVAPAFMSVHLDEIPVLISGFAYGPLLAIFELILKTLIKLPFTTSFGVGELGDLMYSLALILPATIIYKYHRNIKGAVVGLSIGLILNLLFTSVVNLYTIFQLYIQIYFGGKPGIVASAFDAIFHWGITSDQDMRIAVLLLPFNLIKNTIVIGSTFIIYKPLRYVIEKANSSIKKRNKENNTIEEQEKETTQD